DGIGRKKRRTVTLTVDDMRKRKNDVKSYMVNDEDNHALVADEEAPREFALMAKTSAKSEVFDSSLCSKASYLTVGLAVSTLSVLVSVDLSVTFTNLMKGLGEMVLGDASVSVTEGFLF
nr:hypothetical protein [Tanacetum cinerariifolium]